MSGREVVGRLNRYKPRWSGSPGEAGDDLFDELFESPLPGARYALTVVRRRLPSLLAPLDARLSLATLDLMVFRDLARRWRDAALGEDLSALGSLVDETTLLLKEDER